MPAVDLNKEYDRVESKIQSLETYKQVQQGTQEVLKGTQSSLEKIDSAITSPIDKIAEQKKRYQRQVSTQLDKLLNINQLLPENRTSGVTRSSTVSTVKSQFTEALNTIKSKLPEILQEEMIKQLGCSQEQTYESVINGPGLYIPVQSIDLFGLLKQDPSSALGKLSYEKDPIRVQQNPFSMNRELYQRITQESVSYDTLNGQNYLGLSNQNLFDIEYVTSDNNGNSGNFYKVNLKPRNTSEPLISQFFADYFKTIKIVDTKNIFLQVFQILFGAISIDIKGGSGSIEDQLYFQKILNRILGLCFDDRAEIDVSGIAKIAPLDGIDDSFFELTDIDLREIESKLSQIKLGVVEYPDCTNVQLPLDINALLDTFAEILSVDDDDAAGNLAVFDKSIDAIKKNKKWPQLEEIGLNIDTNIIQQLPVALYAAMLSPKVLLPFMLMVKSLESFATGQSLSVVDEVYDLKTFLNKFKVFNVQVMSKIGAEFVKILRNIIIRDLRKLLRGVTADLRKSQTAKQYAIISQLLESAIVITQIINDYRQCKSVIEDILNLIEISLRGTRFEVPAFLLPLASLRTGFNSTRAMLETISQLQKYGVPTGTLPDGSPNIGMIAIKAQIEGSESERDKNSKVLGMTPTQVITPIGTTIPVRFSAILG
jgi:hypothetical protein